MLVQPGVQKLYQQLAQVRGRMPRGDLPTRPSDALGMSLYDNLRFDYLRDISPVASLGRGMAVLVVAPSFPAKSFSEFIAYAKSNKGKLSLGSAGMGSISHLCWALLGMMTGVETTHVP